MASRKRPWQGSGVTTSTGGDGVAEERQLVKAEVMRCHQGHLFGDFLESERETNIGREIEQTELLISQRD